MNTKGFKLFVYWKFNEFPILQKFDFDKLFQKIIPQAQLSFKPIIVEINILFATAVKTI